MIHATCFSVTGTGEDSKTWQASLQRHISAPLPHSLSPARCKHTGRCPEQTPERRKACDFQRTHLSAEEKRLNCILGAAHPLASTGERSERLQPAQTDPCVQDHSGRNAAVYSKKGSQTLRLMVISYSTGKNQRTVDGELPTVRTVVSAAVVPWYRPVALH